MVGIKFLHHQEVTKQYDLLIQKTMNWKGSKTMAKEMTPYEKSAIIGMHRMGCDFAVIGAILGIGQEYVWMIVEEYLRMKID